jgi:glyoxylase-like metal-dependent hydrolase (beta-lactamase superfamily II)
MRPRGTTSVPAPEYVDEILPAHLPQGALSIAVFGPGRGEAIVVRLPDGSIGVVDGCREPTGGAKDGRGDPVRELLRRIEKAGPVPTPFRLAFVCLTHPHDDHYPGLGRLLEAYERRVDHVWTVTQMTGKYARALPEWVELTRGGKCSLPDDATIAGLRLFVGSRAE